LCPFNKQKKKCCFVQRFFCEIKIEELQTHTMGTRLRNSCQLDDQSKKNRSFPAFEHSVNKPQKVMPWGAVGTMFMVLVLAQQAETQNDINDHFDVSSPIASGSLKPASNSYLRGFQSRDFIHNIPQIDDAENFNAMVKSSLGSGDREDWNDFMAKLAERSAVLPVGKAPDQPEDANDNDDRKVPFVPDTQFDIDGQFKPLSISQGLAHIGTRPSPGNDLGTFAERDLEGAENTIPQTAAIDNETTKPPVDPDDPEMNYYPVPESLGYHMKQFWSGNALFCLQVFTHMNVQFSKITHKFRG
jgi:hypothetical protein